MIIFLGRDTEMRLKNYQSNEYIGLKKITFDWLRTNYK